MNWICAQFENNLDSLLWSKEKRTKPKKFRSQIFDDKVLASLFWNSRDVNLFDYLGKEKTITGENCSILLDQNIVKNRRGINSKWNLFLQYNAHKMQIAYLWYILCHFFMIIMISLFKRLFTVIKLRNCECLKSNMWHTRLYN